MDCDRRGVFWFFGRVVISLGDEARSKREFEDCVWDHQRRLALRKIWRSTKDENIVAQIKSLYGAWSLLYPEKTDEEYEQHVRSSGGSGAFKSAKTRAEIEGSAYYLKDGKVYLTISKND